MPAQVTPPPLESNLEVLRDTLYAMSPFIDDLAEIDDPATRRMQDLVYFIWLICRGIRDTDPSVNPIGASALVRSAQEAYVALYYFCGEEVDQAEREMRDALWAKQLHGKHIEVLKGATTESQADPEISRQLMQHEQGLARAKEVLTRSTKIAAIQEKDATLAGRLINNVNEHFAEFRSDIWDRSGLGKQLFRNMWNLFSQTSHATPWAINSLTRYGGPRVGTSAGISSIAIHLAVVCMAESVKVAARELPRLSHRAALVVERAMALSLTKG